MIQKFQNLSSVLERMLVLYERVLGLLEQERRFLILLDFENLYVLMREKDEILATLRALDKDRLRVQDQCLLVMGFADASLSLKEMAESLASQDDENSQAVAQQLLMLRMQLAAVIEALQERVSSNRHFTEKSIESLQSVAAHLSSALAGKKKGKAKGGTYTGKARYAAKESVAGSIVEKRL